MIAPGTLCLIVGALHLVERNSDGSARYQMPLPSRICTIAAVRGDCGVPDCDHVCVVTLSDERPACVDLWAYLRPLSPPPAIADAQHERDVELAA